jgi:predicted acyltransferase (DUF342 family)
MADTRINALTTAATTTSDDFLPIDGTTNGSKKLSAFSPTFGGNATVTGNLAVGGNVTTTGTATITGGIVGPVTVTGGVIGANSETIALRPNGVTSTSNQVTLDTAGFFTVPVLDVNNSMGCYGLASFYGGATVEVELNVIGAIGSTGNINTESGVRALGGIYAEDSVLATDQYLQIRNDTAPVAYANHARIYVDTDGDLKVKFGNGVTKTLATDTA